MSTDINNSNMSTPPAWDGIELPIGWLLNEKGVFYRTTRLARPLSRSKSRICGPFWVDRFVLNQGTNTCGRPVSFYDKAGNLRHMEIPDEDLSWYFLKMAQVLSAAGLYVSHGRGMDLAGYYFGFAPENQVNGESGVG